LLGGSVAAVSGIADQLVWGEFPDWADVAKSVFPVASAGVSVFLVAALCRVGTRSVRLARVSKALGAIVIAVALFSAVSQSTRSPLIAAAMLVSAATVLLVAGWTWQRGDMMGAWVAGAHVPMIVT